MKNHQKLITHLTRAVNAGALLALAVLAAGCQSAPPVAVRPAAAPPNPGTTMDAVACHHQALTQARYGFCEAAIAADTQAIALKPDYAEAYCLRGDMKEKMHDSDGAIADYNQAIALRPDYAEAYDNRGLAKQAKLDFHGALADYHQAIDLRRAAHTNLPKTVPVPPVNKEAAFFARLKLADQIQQINVRQIKGFTDADMAEDTKIIELKSASAQARAEACDRRGRAKGLRGDWPGAIADFTQAIQFKPDYQPAHYDLMRAEKQAKGVLKSPQSPRQRWLDFNVRASEDVDY